MTGAVKVGRGARNEELAKGRERRNKEPRRRGEAESNQEGRGECRGECLVLEMIRGSLLRGVVVPMLNSSSQTPHRELQVINHLFYVYIGIRCKSSTCIN